MSDKIGIIVIGNEILSGKTLDTNSYWLTKKLYEDGYEIQRIIVIPDDVKIISNTLTQFINKLKFDFILLCGGLGPTQDDKTTEGIAKGLKLKIILNKEALRLIKKRYNDAWLIGKISNPTITLGRRKMALLPETASIMPNYIGFGPGFFLKYKIKTKTIMIIALPGVPKELKHIFKENIENKIIPKNLTDRIIKEIKVKISESLLYELFSSIEKKYPKLKFESHPKLETGAVIIRLISFNKNEIDDVLKDINIYLNNIPSFALE
jgi:molybdenum cofactor synthesis domain-containing protein